MTSCMVCGDPIPQERVYANTCSLLCSLIRSERQMGESLTHAQERIERLRAALDRIASGRGDPSGRMQNIALQALEEDAR